MPNRSRALVPFQTISVNTNCQLIRKASNSLTELFSRRSRLTHADTQHDRPKAKPRINLSSSPQCSHKELQESRARAGSFSALFISFSLKRARLGAVDVEVSDYITAGVIAVTDAVILQNGNASRTHKEDVKKGFVIVTFGYSSSMGGCDLQFE